MQPLDRSSCGYVVSHLKRHFGIILPGQPLHKQHETFKHSDHLTDMQLNPDGWLTSFEVKGSVPCFLWMTMLALSGLEYPSAVCILIERFSRIPSSVPKMSLCKLVFQPGVFVKYGTLLQGDMVTMRKDDKTRIFLASDIIGHAGELLSRVPFGDRFLKLMHVVSSDHIPDLIGSPMLLCVRPHFALTQLHAIAISSLPLDYGSGDVMGILFRSIHTSRSVIKLFRPVPSISAGDPMNLNEEADVEEVLTLMSEVNIDHNNHNNEGKESEVRSFYVFATHLPDVFELRNNPNDPDSIGTAAVPSMKESTNLQEAARIGKPLSFRHDHRFNKWVLCEN